MQALLFALEVLTGCLINRLYFFLTVYPGILYPDLLPFLFYFIFYFVTFYTSGQVVVSICIKLAYVSMGFKDILQSRNNSHYRGCFGTVTEILFFDLYKH